MRRRTDLAQEVESSLRQDTEASHARVDVQVHPGLQPEPARALLQGGASVARVQPDVHSVLEAGVHLAVDERAEDENRNVDARRAQLESFGRGSHAERADPAAQRMACNGDGAQSVGVGLHDEHHAYAGFRPGSRIRFRFAASASRSTSAHTRSACTTRR